ncbi:hypothetical protein LWI29_001653 [Acer saccharum]|uniref:Uncharacterized protein n=1 Tax=Acer saccharum TaxID=4024 RepID=A0AA39UZ54_ACESA|nr:hypothetical protein LWI29_001653 [Acer saccharum]
MPRQEGEEQDDSDKVPNKDDKGIEMEQDFATDTFSVSEDPSGDDDDDKDGEDDNWSLQWEKLELIMKSLMKSFRIRRRRSQHRKRKRLDDLSDTENAEDLNMDKDEAFADPSGLKLDEPNQFG